MDASGTPAKFEIPWANSASPTTDFMALGVLGWRDQRGEFYPES